MDDKMAIEAAITQFVKAYNAGNIDGVLAYYSEDLIKLRNGAAPEMKPDIAHRLVEVFGKHHTRVEVIIDEIGIVGEVAFTRGSFRVTLTPKTGSESQMIERRYLEVWRKKGGRWWVVRAMDNVG